MDGAQRQAGAAAKVGISMAVTLFGLGYIVATLYTQPSASARETVLTSGEGSRGSVVASLDAVFANAADTRSMESRELELLVYNTYTKEQPITEYGWDYLAEPHRPSTMVLIGWPEPSAELDYSWLVDGHLQGYGSTCDVVFTTTGYHNVTITAFVPEAEDGDGRLGFTASIVAQRDFSVMVKYVRREIRSLTDADREAYFNAAAVLQRVPTSAGRALYGDKYFSKDFLVRIHLYYGGMQGCDHWHQGAGFVTSHVAYTLMYEQALQAVNPTVTVPYWDFTIESTFYDVSDWRSSPVFSGDWFGSIAPKNSLHAVTEGRFAYASAMTDARAFSALTNSYGVMRGPWNNDPTPFMTRSETVYGFTQNLKPSGCSEYFIAMRRSSWMALAMQLNAAAHGHIHETVGGAWSHFMLREVGSGGPAVYDFVHKMQAMSKELWRAGFLACPENCAENVAWRKCACTCSAESLRGLSPFEVLSEAGVLDAVSFYDDKRRLMKPKTDEDGVAVYGFVGYTDNEAAKAYKSILRLLCAPGHLGDMFQATSPNDITFWVLHPTLDRLWHWKRLADDPNFDDRWPASHSCYGHNPDDFQPFKNLYDSDDRYYSNRELYSMFSPQNDDLPYIYDNFNWPHCEALGYDMTKRTME